VRKFRSLYRPALVGCLYALGVRGEEATPGAGGAASAGGSAGARATADPRAGAEAPGAGSAGSAGVDSPEPGSPGSPGSGAPGANGGSPSGAAGAPVIPPRLLSEAVVDYPEGASGSADVVLQLVIAKTGEVLQASVAQGDEPFAGAALRSASSWRFEPARSGDMPVAVKIRFLVSFKDPNREPPIAALPPGGEPAPSPVSPAVPAAPRPARPIEVTVRGQRPEPLARRLSRAEVSQLPGAFGDPFRAIEALPGVTPVASGVPFFYVRGAPPGNVGYFLDGIRVPLLYHVGLGPSVVHPGMVANVDLYPGAYPTRYGRFSGGIVAGEATEPADEWRGEWQLRLFDAGAMVEAPLFGGRGHALVGGRYSYTAYLISLLGQDVRLEYWDYQLRAGYRLSPSDELSVFAFGSFDYFGEDTSAPDDQLFATEFHRIDLRHRHDFSETANLRSAVTLGYDRTRVSEDIGAAQDRRLSLRSEYENRVNPRIRLRAGLDAALDRYRIEGDIDDEFDDDPPPVNVQPGADRPGLGPPLPAQMPMAPQFPDDQRDEGAEFDRLFPTRSDTVVGGYVELGWEATPSVSFVPGLRLDMYRSGEASAWSLEPRLSAEFRVTERLTLKNALGLAAQPPSFVLPVAGFEIGGLPGGLQRSVQSSAGIEYSLPDAMELSLTVFHNAFFNMTDVLSLARVDFRTQDGREDLLPDTRTRGQAYGLEVMFHRNLTRRLGGFLSYTLSRSVRSSVLGRFPASFDRTHVLNAAIGYDLGRHWRAGGRLVFYTGNPYFPPGTPPGNQRLPAFHRLDLRLEKRWPIGSAGAYCAFAIEGLNTTLSKEVVSRTCEDGVCKDESIGPVTIPSLSFEGRF
jgi:TonB-dependent receptor-like protein/TonB-like protein